MIHLEAQIHPSVRIWNEHLSNIGKCKIGEHCVIHSHVWIGDDVEIGDGVKIQAFSFIPLGVTIEGGCFIGPRVTFTNDKNPPSRGQSWSKTRVCENVSIGAGAVILPGITIGAGAVIGAGSVVTKSIPAFEVWVGNPAHKLE